jgi:hypothetical protein
MAGDNGSIRLDPKSGVSIPIAVFLFALAELIGGVWWGATLTERYNTLKDEKNRIEIESKARDIELKNDLDLEVVKRERLERQLLERGFRVRETRKEED